MCREFGWFPAFTPAVVVLVSLVVQTRPGEARRRDQPPTEVRHGLLTGFVRFDQGLGREGNDRVAWSIVRDRLNLQVPLRSDLVVEASGDLVVVRDPPEFPEVLLRSRNYPTFASSVGPKLRLLSGSTGPDLALGAFYEFRYRSDPFFRFRDERTQHFVDLALIGTWERTHVSVQAAGGVNVSMDQGDAASNELFLGIAPAADIGGPLGVLAEYGLAYVQYGEGPRVPLPFSEHLRHKVAAGFSYSAARARWAIRYVGAFHIGYHAHLAQLSLTWFFR